MFFQHSSEWAAARLPMPIYQVWHQPCQSNCQNRFEIGCFRHLETGPLPEMLSCGGKLRNLCILNLPENTFNL